MKLSKIFTESIKQSDNLVKLYETVISKNRRSARRGWSDKVFAAKIVRWGKNEGLWRISKSDLLIIGKCNNSTASEETFFAQNLEVLLRSAFVLAMATIDKILHEALLNHFYVLINTDSIDGLATIPLSESYKISLTARIRKGKGGQIKSRPGHKFKALFLEKAYEKTLLSTSSLEQICAKCEKIKYLIDTKMQNP